MTTDSLKKYEGDYYIGPVTLNVSVQKDALHLTVPGQPEYELIPVATDKFVIKNMNGYTIIFDRDEKNEITGLTSAQPNGSFKAGKKPAN